MTSYIIEKDIPLPTPRNHSLYPFADMEVGDSFLIPCDKTERKRVEHRVRKAAGAHGIKNKTRFAVRFVEGGVRIWRIETQSH